MKSSYYYYIIIIISIIIIIIIMIIIINSTLITYSVPAERNYVITIVIGLPPFPNKDT